VIQLTRQEWIERRRLDRLRKEGLAS